MNVTYSLNLDLYNNYHLHSESPFLCLVMEVCVIVTFTNLVHVVQRYNPLTRIPRDEKAERVTRRRDGG